MNFFLKIWPFLWTGALAVVLPASLIFLSSILGRRAPDKTKLSTYECGLQPESVLGDARHHIKVGYYLIAMCFLVLDVEIIFFAPWAVLAQTLLWSGLKVMLPFLGVLFLGWFYLYKRGIFQWE
jgi:NADH-quinone oxidoreductase subunit A